VRHRPKTATCNQSPEKEKSGEKIDEALPGNLGAVVRKKKLQRQVNWKAKQGKWLFRVPSERRKGKICWPHIVAKKNSPFPRGRATIVSTPMEKLRSGTAKKKDLKLKGKTPKNNRLIGIKKIASKGGGGFKKS